MHAHFRTVLESVPSSLLMSIFKPVGHIVAATTEVAFLQSATFDMQASNYAIEGGWRPPTKLSKLCSCTNLFVSLK
eukprot:scaffold132108_cov22-Prasinocladus_malaysianus.AAC.1